MKSKFWRILGKCLKAQVNFEEENLPYISFKLNILLIIANRALAKLDGRRE
jgi:hypothetical protein